MLAFRWLIALSALLHAAAASADLWAYVDAQGHSHVADHRVDARYRLFYKGRTTLDAPSATVAARARAIDALVGTPLYRRATDPARAQRFEALIASNARITGLDAALVKALIAVESGFEPRAVSDKGAIGLMQVLPDTGKRYGVTADAKRSIAAKLLDPATNVRIGTRYLRDLLARFPQDLSLALAAYNAGEGSVEAHDNRVPPFAETRGYVTLVQQVYALYRPDVSAATTPVRILPATTMP
jgi:soluble lytic murein transglycosylase-like protein